MGAPAQTQELCLSPPSFANPESVGLFLQLNKEQSLEKLAINSPYSHIKQLQETPTMLPFFSARTPGNTSCSGVCVDTNTVVLSPSHGHLHAAGI